MNLESIADDNIQSKAKDFVNSTATRTLAILNSNAASPAKKKSLEAVFHDVVDIPWMGKFVVAKEWKNMSPAQQTQYIKVYTQYLINSYVPKFVEYNNQQYSITSVKSLERGHFVVSTEIIDKVAGSKTSVAYRLKALQSGGFKIIDIVGENVSLLSTQQSDFGSIISQKGIDGLIDTLAKKVSN